MLVAIGAINSVLSTSRFRKECEISKSERNEYRRCPLRSSNATGLRHVEEDASGGRKEDPGFRSIKGRDICEQMLKSSCHHTANMKLLSLSVICFAAAVVAAPADKQKRDILPGDPRYGTDYHHHHQHVHNNEVQTVKAAGGFVGSYAVPNDHSHETLSSYESPNYQAGEPLGSEFSTNDAKALQVPATSYGIPDTVQNVNKNYLGPVAEEKNHAVKAHLNADYELPSAEAPAVSYADVKHEEHEQPQSGTSVAKTVVHEQPAETHPSNGVSEVYQAQQPAVVQKHVVAAALPQVKAAAPQSAQGAYQHGSVSTYTFPAYTSYSSIPVKTVDRHVQVQVPQPYPVPVTKHVTYSVPVAQPVEVPKPYYVRVPQPVRVTVDHPYPVEVPRAVPYPVPHYVRTSIPVLQHHAYSATKQAPWNPFPEYVTSIQNALGNLNIPDFSSFSFPNFLEGFPSFLPSQPTPSPPPAQVGQSEVSFSSSSDAIAVESPAAKFEAKPSVARPVTVQQTQEVYKPSTACAGCSVTKQTPPDKQPEAAQSTNQQEYVQPAKQPEYVQPTDANGGYVY